MWKCTSCDYHFFVRGNRVESAKKAGSVKTKRKRAACSCGEVWAPPELRPSHPHAKHAFAHFQVEAAAVTSDAGPVLNPAPLQLVPAEAVDESDVTLSSLMAQLNELKLENARLRAAEPAEAKVCGARQKKLTEFPGLIVSGTHGAETDDSFIHVRSKHYIRLTGAIASQHEEAGSALDCSDFSMDELLELLPVDDVEYAIHGDPEARAEATSEVPTCMDTATVPDMCTICRDSVGSDSGPVCKLNCEHSFHNECITKWMMTQTCKRCPNCRGAIREHTTFFADGRDPVVVKVNKEPSKEDLEPRRNPRGPDQILSAYDQAVIRSFRLLGSDVPGTHAIGFDASTSRSTRSKSRA